MNVRSFPDSLSLVGNMRHLVVETTEDVSFSIRIQGASTDIVKRVFSPNSDHIMEVDLFDIVSPELSFSLQNESSPYRQTDIVKTFVITLKGVSSNQTQTVTFTALRGGVDHLADTAELFLQQNFLTWQPNLKPVTYYTPEFLTYYATVASMVKCKARIGGSDTTVTLASIPAGQAWTIPVQYAVIAGKVDGLPSYYDVWVENGNGDRLTYVQRYYAQDMRSEDEQWILFENSLGGVDTFRAYGSTEVTADHSHNIAEIEDVTEEFRVDTTRKYKKNTGRLDRKERLWLLDFFPSLVKYVYAGDYLRRIVVTDSDVNYKASELPSQYNFTYKYADAKPYLNIPRADAPLEVLDINIPEVGSFTVAPRLAEFPRIQLSSGALFPVQDPYSSSWAATTLGAIAQFFIQYIIGSYPGGGGIGHTHSNFDFLEDLSWDKLLRKDMDDTARGFIRFMRGLQVGEQFVSGILGEGGVFRKDADGKTYIEADKMYVRMKAYFDTVEIRRFLHTGGNRIASVAGMKCCRVEWLDSSNNVLEQTDANKSLVKKFRCYFRASDGDDEVRNDFQIGDQAYCHVTSVTTSSDNPEAKGLNQKHYWRLVIGRNTEGMLTDDGEAYIDLSNSATNTISGVSYAGYQSESDFPEAQDDIIQLGNVNDPTRRGAIVEYVSGTDTPSYQIYQDINDFNLNGKNYIGLGYNTATGRAYMNVYGDMYIGDKNGQGGYLRFSEIERLLEISGRLNVGSTLADGRNVNNLGTSNGNILLNTSFTGDYDSEDVDMNTDVTPDTVIYSDPLKHWQAAGVTVIDLSDSQSGYAAKIAGGGTLAQTVSLEVGKWYVLSFRGKGGTLSYSIGGVTGTLTLNPSVVDSYDAPFVCGEDSGLNITASSEVTLMELQLCEGNLPTAWKKNYSDGEKTMAAVNEYKYISDAIKNASTDIIGGLILSQIIKVGNYRNKQMTEETGGMSGAWLDENSPFLWGGGDMSQAIYTIAKYANDPSYEPTQQEIDAMAKFVVTHGGRAILNDVILRGYIYALGGYFKGKITAESGEITGDVVVGDIEGKHIVIKPITEEGAAIVMKNGNTELLDMVFGTKGDNVWYPAVFVKHPVNPEFSRLTFAGLLVSSDDVYTRTANYGVGGMSQHGVFNNKSISTGLSIGLDGKVYLHAYNYTDLRHAWADYDSAEVGDVYVDSNGFLKVKQ